MRVLRREIKAGLSKLFLVLALILLAVLTKGCGHLGGEKKIRGSEVWLIDHKEPALYRYVEGELVQIIPIQFNEDMEKFLCLDKEEYKDLVNDMNRKACDY